ncbi:Splicing factor Cactin C-terminal domain-containing protein [Entamoeba marina]
MEVEGIHPLIKPTIQSYFHRQTNEKLHQLKEMVDKKIDENPTNIQYWRAIRVEIGIHIQKCQTKEKQTTKKDTEFTRECQKPLKPLQRIISDYVEVKNNSNQTIVPLYHCRVNHIKPRTSYSAITGKVTEVVDGYEINVYYEKMNGKAQYRIEKMNDEYSLLIVFAESPYKDIGFKIVKGNIDYSHRHGYSCYFEKGMFHLRFRFKQEFYTID